MEKKENITQLPPNAGDKAPEEMSHHTESLLADKSIVTDILGKTKEALTVVAPIIEEVKGSCCPTKKIAPLETSVGEDEGCCTCWGKKIPFKELSKGIGSCKFGFGANRNLCPNPYGNERIRAGCKAYESCKTADEKIKWYHQWLPQYGNEVVEAFVKSESKQETIYNLYAARECKINHSLKGGPIYLYSGQTLPISYIDNDVKEIGCKGCTCPDELKKLIHELYIKK